MATSSSSQPPSSDPRLPAKLEEIYDSYRTALMRSKYYAYRMRTYKRLDKFLEILLAVGTSGTVGGLAILQTGYGKVFWTVIAGFSALLAIIKPILNLQNKIESYSKLHIANDSIFSDIKRVTVDISTNKGLSIGMEMVFDFIKTRYGALGLVEDGPPARKLLRKCYNEVNAEIPPESLWIPS